MPKLINIKDKIKYEESTQYLKDKYPSDKEVKRPLRKSEGGRYDKVDTTNLDAAGNDVDAAPMKMPKDYMKMPKEYMMDEHDKKRMKKNK